VDEVEDQRSTDMLTLLAQVHAYAEAHDLSAAEVAARLHALLSNNPPAEGDAAELTHNQQAGRAWLEMPRRQQEELRRRNQRLAAENDALPGSNEPPPDTAYWEKKRAEFTAVLERTKMPQQQRELWADLLLARHAYQRGLNAADATLWALDALRRFFEPPGSVLAELGLLDPVHAIYNAIEAAVAGNMAPLHRLLPGREGAAAGEPPIPAAARRKVLVAGAMEALRLGGVMRGAAETKTVAAKEVRKAFAAAGVDLAEQTPRQNLDELERLERDHTQGKRGRDQLAEDKLALFRALKQAAREHLAAGHWPLEERMAWVQLVAAKAAIASL
jgi:hypothetical protein